MVWAMLTKPKMIGGSCTWEVTAGAMDFLFFFRDATRPEIERMLDNWHTRFVCAEGDVTLGVRVVVAGDKLWPVKKTVSKKAAKKAGRKDKRA